MWWTPEYGQRLTGDLARGARTKTLGVQGVDQLPDRPVAEGVGLERPAEGRGPLLIDDDVAGPGVVDELLAVEVAERCAVRGGVPPRLALVSMPLSTSAARLSE